MMKEHNHLNDNVRQNYWKIDLLLNLLQFGFWVAFLPAVLCLVLAWMTKNLSYLICLLVYELVIIIVLHKLRIDIESFNLKKEDSVSGIEKDNNEEFYVA